MVTFFAARTTSMGLGLRSSMDRARASLDRASGSSFGASSSSSSSYRSSTAAPGDYLSSYSARRSGNMRFTTTRSYW